MFTEQIKDEQLKAKIEAKRGFLQQMLTGAIAKDDPEVKPFIEEATRDTHAYTLPPDRIVRIDEEAEVGSMPLPSHVLEYFIRKSSHRFILHHCPCREAAECHDYPRDLGCMFLGEAAKDFHPELGRPASVEQALEHARRCKEAGLVTNMGYAPADAAFFEVGPAERCMTICACCPCCCINRVFEYRTKMPGIEVRIVESCSGCGICVDTCAHHGMVMEEGQPRTTDSCVGCGRCVDACPEDAIEVVVTDPSYIEKTLQSLSEKVDVT